MDHVSAGGVIVNAQSGYAQQWLGFWQAQVAGSQCLSALSNCEWSFCATLSRIVPALMNTLRTLNNCLQVLTVIQIDSGFSAPKPNCETANLKVKMRFRNSPLTLTLC